ncbi:hypothetical protein EAO75_14930 [Streptomyces sp. uw30]|nr:hypothetical protein EAO75_14930 [Streptomyces sp. uw30]
MSTDTAISYDVFVADPLSIVDVGHANSDDCSVLHVPDLDLVVVGDAHGRYAVALRGAHLAARCTGHRVPHKPRPA